jgi:hypothetical protein
MKAMKRRVVLLLPVALSGGFVVSHAATPSPKVQSLDDALRWLDLVDKNKPQTTGQWPLVAVLNHLAQSIEMSLDGFAQPKSAIFQSTVGAAAFSYFKWRAAMSHGLAEPIPGAPTLPMQGDAAPAAQRLRASINRFQAHTGALMPHFAYGQLSRADYALAHSFHIANHQDEINA